MVSFTRRSSHFYRDNCNSGHFRFKCVPNMNFYVLKVVIPITIVLDDERSFIFFGVSRVLEYTSASENHPTRVTEGDMALAHCN